MNSNNSPLKFKNIADRNTHPVFQDKESPIAINPLYDTGNGTIGSPAFFHPAESRSDGSQDVHSVCRKRSLSLSSSIVFAVSSSSTRSSVRRAVS